MVQISSTTNSVIFTFDGNQHYLSNGTIEVPKDSLALVVDDSDMVTFKKADSNDIFLSITLDELGMTKDEIISFYQSDMTGGDGVTPEEVEEMIDEATSGKADTSTVETLSGEVQTLSGEVANKADTTALTAYFDDAKYEMSGQTHVINFYNGQTVKATINADDFIKDGMVDTVVVSGNNLVITFNTDSGKQPIIIPLSDIFDPTNYYTTGQTDNLIAAATSGKADTSTVETLSGEVQTVSGQVANKADTTALTAHTSDATIHVTSADKTAWNGKQDTLVSGSNIKTINNQSLLGSGDIEIQGGMTPAQEETIATALNELYDGIDEVSGNVGTLSGQVTANTSNISTVSGSVQTLSTTVSGIQTNLGGIKFVALTQAQYDALVVKDANTLYIIND